MSEISGLLVKIELFIPDLQIIFRALVSYYLGLAARGDVGEKATSITAKNSLG